MSNNNGKNGEFDDDVYDDDFIEADYDETALDDPEMDVIEDDADYNDEDFGNEEWDDPAAPAATGKPGSLYKSEKKGLSFNTIVMIGAGILGVGVLAFTVMTKSAEQSENSKGIFQSIVDIGGVMDGMLFGEKEETPPAGDVTAVNGEAAQDGFLNNPESATSPDAQNPPQPSPIAPETADAGPLTPMPGTDGNATPRGPEDGLPVAPDPVEAMQPMADVPPAAVEDAPAPGSAEDILKQAMANREQKMQEQDTPSTETAQQAPVVIDAPTVPAPEAAPEVVPSPTVADVVVPPQTPPAPAQAEKQAQAPVPAPAAETPAQAVVAASPAVDPAELAANRRAVESLEGKIDTLLKRMEQMEGEIGSVRESRQADYKQIESSVNALKKDIVEIKDRPVPVAAAPAPVPAKTAETPKKVETRTPDAEAEEDVADATPAPVAEPKPKTVAKKKTAKPAAERTSTRTAAKASSGRWELRAAQPGRAWVSKPGERDMQSIEIGQTLPGIGSVTGIVYQNNRWTVYGTQGQINQ